LENDPKWEAFTQAAAKARKKMQQTSAAHLMPPNQRTKSRFLNIEILTCWAINALAVITNVNHPEKTLLEKYCGWLVDYKDFIEQLKQFDQINRSVRHHIREHGISTNTGKQIEIQLDEAIKDAPLNMTACEYAGKLIDFFTEQSKIVPPNQVW
jgi:predicted RNase H-like nuclease